MTIPRNEETRKFLINSNLRYAGPLAEVAIDSDYKFIELFSVELPVLGEKDFEKAMNVGEKYGLKVKWCDFHLGEGKSDFPYPMLVYVRTCNSL